MTKNEPKYIREVPEGTSEYPEDTLEDSKLEIRN